MAKTVHDYLGVPADWKVKENTKHEIVLIPNARDVRTAVRGDPRACALRNAACRVFNIPNAMIGSRHAYIPQRDETGRPYIARVNTPPATRKAIENFDKTGEMPEYGFRFTPTPPSQQLKNRRKKSKSSSHGASQPNRHIVKKTKRGSKSIRVSPALTF